MPVIAEATAHARVLARRGANAAAVVIGASFHPFRTVREGATVVRGLVNPPADPIPGAPTDAAQPPTGEPRSSGSTPKTPPGPDTVAKPVQPPAEEPTSERTDGRPVEARGPAPHIPPRIAGEVERDYGEDLPGITDGLGEEPADEVTDVTEVTGEEG